MSSLNFGSIQSKIADWEKSEKGQKRIQGKINQYVRKNIDKTKAGSTVVTVRKMREASRQLIQNIRNFANGCDLPPSVIAHFGSLHAEDPVLQPDGSYLIEINFTDDLTRASLRPEDYGGVINIVAIFNNGYPKDRSRSEAISHISGWWHGKETTALGYRPRLNFMQDAVKDFNENYGVKFGMYAEVGVIYE